LASEKQTKKNEVKQKKKIREMISCDKCDEWFHFDCVGITAKTAKRAFLCPSCQQKEQNIVGQRDESIKSTKRTRNK
jgi:Zn finger protein HypA/HybF involved in hydrogenase expression